MKTLCYSNESLNELMSELFLAPAEVIFCEDREVEMVKLPEGREFPLEDAFDEMNARFNIEITSFDVRGLEDVGEVFVFFI